MNSRSYPFYAVSERFRITGFYSFFRCRYRRGYSFAGEIHDFWECLYVLDGELCVTADDRVYHMRQGEIIFHKPLEFHKFTITSSGASLMILSFFAEGTATDLIQNKVFVLNDRHKEIVEELLIYAHSYVKGAEAFSEPSEIDIALFLRASSEIPHYLQTVTCYLYRLFFSLAECGVDSPISSSPEILLFRKAVGYLNDNLHRHPTLEEIASRCNISQASLERLFKKYADVGTHRYFLNLKMKIATDLLQKKESVSQVAEKLGFSDQGYFSRVYKRETGVVPTDVKKGKNILR